MVRTVSHQVSCEKRRDGSFPMEGLCLGVGDLAPYSVDSDERRGDWSCGVPIEKLAAVNGSAGNVCSMGAHADQV